MKKLYLLVPLCLAGVFSASAQSGGRDGHEFVLGTSIGLLAGQSEELVYRSEDSEDKLSQLLWNFKPLVYAGIDLHYRWRIPESSLTVFVDSAFKFGFPGETGIIEDRDWGHTSYADWLTHYSVHDNKTENAVIVDLSLGTAVRILEKYTLRAFVSYSSMNFSWTASAGSFLYPAADGGHAYLTVTQDVGTYEQLWTIVSPGISFYGEFNRRFALELFFKLSPLLWFSATDEHLNRNLVITGEYFGGIFLEPGFLFSFKRSDLLTVSLSFLYRTIRGSRGDGVYKQQGQSTYTAKNLSGAGYSAFDIGIIARFTISNYFK